MEVDKQNLNDQPFYIVFKNVEYLRKISGNVIPMLLRLPELSKRKVCPIFISGVNPEKLCSLTSITEILPIYFPEYSKDELVRILTKECPKNYTEQFYSNFIKLVLSVFFPVCRNLREIRHIVRKHFLLYVDPIEKGDLTENDVTKLWRCIEPHLKSNLHQVYLRDSEGSGVDVQSAKPCETWRVELPFYSKYLLIAAYLASYNPAKLDKQYFLKKHDKVTKRMKLNAMKKKSVSFHLLGPKPFPLERLIAIFCSITDDDSALSLPILSQISSLISLNFLQKIGNKDVFDSPKFKCLISLEVVRNIARSVEFSIDRYLYDFT
ncbi:Origin recognition complex subunit 5 [Chamberlinius hualienensis]